MDFTWDSICTCGVKEYYDALADSLYFRMACTPADFQHSDEVTQLELEEFECVSSSQMTEISSFGHLTAPSQSSVPGTPGSSPIMSRKKSTALRYTTKFLL